MNYYNVFSNEKVSTLWTQLIWSYLRLNQMKMKDYLWKNKLILDDKIFGNEYKINIGSRKNYIDLFLYNIKY